MSTISSPTEQDSTALDPACPQVKLLLQAKEKELGGFSVRRLLPSARQRLVGPWIFFDHMGPADFPAGKGIDVRPHPHINLATVTYLFEGEILHRDSLANRQPIRPGDINLMVAGHGIVHSERERREVRDQRHTLHGLQLWLALPEADEETDPAFYHYPQNDIPKTDIDGVAVRVMMGSAYGLTSPVKTFAQTLYIEAHLKAGQCLSLPMADQRAVYVAKGQVQVAESNIDTYQMAVLHEGVQVTLHASKESRIALIGGEVMSPRHIFWNFVSSRKERIEQASDDWKSGRFPTVPGDEEDFIPLPD